MIINLKRSVESRQFKDDSHRFLQAAQPNIAVQLAAAFHCLDQRCQAHRIDECDVAQINNDLVRLGYALKLRCNRSRDVGIEAPGKLNNGDVINRA